jgi:hypothetical protein
MRLGTLARFGFVMLASILLLGARAGAQPNRAGFPDVPPWHWAYQGVLKDAQAGLLIGYPVTPAVLIENSITQVYDGFVHAHAQGAQAWIERFTFHRPAVWPAPLDRTELASFSLRDVRPTVTGDAATATFVAETLSGAGPARTAMHVALRLLEGDWKIDYATLAAGSSLFR